MRPGRQQVDWQRSSKPGSRPPCSSSGASHVLRTRPHSSAGSYHPDSAGFLCSRSWGQQRLSLATIAAIASNRYRVCGLDAWLPTGERSTNASPHARQHADSGTSPSELPWGTLPAVQLLILLTARNCTVGQAGGQQSLHWNACTCMDNLLLSLQLCSAAQIYILRRQF
jgi:hypothetical protein